MAWEDLCQYYDVIYLSWNPALFKESSCIHRWLTDSFTHSLSELTEFKREARLSG